MNIPRVGDANPPNDLLATTKLPKSDAFVVAIVIKSIVSTTALLLGRSLQQIIHEFD